MPRRGPATNKRPPAADPPRDARDAACRALAAQARAFPLLIPTPPDTAGLESREAALAHAIHYAAIRRWLTLSFLIERAGGRPMGDLEPAIRAVLLAGAAQLLLLDRVPAHAAIDQSVEWAKRRIRPKAAGLVNAVLRRMNDLIARDADGSPAMRDRWSDTRDEIPMPDGTARALAADALPHDPLERLSIATSVPRRALDRWNANAAPGPSQELRRTRALHALVHPPTILNTRHANPAGPALPDALSPHSQPSHHVWTGTHGDLSALLASRPDIWVQDPASSASAELARGAWSDPAAHNGAPHPEPRLIADVCAGQGTKTRQLTALFPDAEILATDTDPARLDTLRATFATHPRVRVVTRDQLAADALARGDLVLLDVPCSNTGVLPRRPEARYRLTDRTLERMGEIQRQIGADAIPLLAPRGRILYATCSLEPEENQAMARWFARWHNLRELASQSIEPAGLPGDPPAAYRDGSFAVLLGR